MNRIPLLLVGAVAGLMLFAAQNVRAADETTSGEMSKPDKDGYYSLFDGHSLDGWKVGNNADAWEAKDGMIIVHSGPSHLFYVGPVHHHDWKDFHLKAIVMTYPHANSGIYFHTSFQYEGWPAEGFESQINATHTDWRKTGSLYLVQDIKDPHHVDNKWFQYDIIVKGKNVKLEIDGTTVVDWTETKDFVPPKQFPARYLHHGTFALQGHDPHSKTMFKDIRVKALDE